MIPAKNQEFTIRIEDISKEGEGIGHANGYTLFVKDAVPGDLARVGVTKAGKNFGYARLIEVIEPSADRVCPACPSAKQCGGCQIMALSYEAQCRFKEKQVENALKRIGGFETERILLPIRGAAHPLRYRNKAQYPVRMQNGTITAGFYAQHSHRIVEQEDCLLNPPHFRTILNAVLSDMKQYGISAYDEAEEKGLVRHVLIRQGAATGEIHVCIIINGSSMPHFPEIASHLMALNLKEEENKRAAEAFSLTSIPHVTGVSLNENRTRGNVILGKSICGTAGRETAADRIGTVNYEISPLSFYQVNPEQTHILYDTVKDYAGLTGKEHVWDLYCGIGTIGLYLADRAAKVTGIEIVPRAIEDANMNAALNGFRNADYHAGAAEDLLPVLLNKEREAGEQKHVVILDPPRKGCAASLLETLLSLKPEKIIYVSCDPATLARDLRILAEGGYCVGRVQPVDMFPQTVHVETVVLLSRENK